MAERNKIVFIPILLSFFVMGFVDVIGTVANYMEKDFGLQPSQTGWIPSLVFLWFFVLAIPTGVIMNRIGRKKMVLWSLFVTAIAVMIPLLKFVNSNWYTFESAFVFCCLLGIGNAMIQVSLNPLVSSIVSGDRLASALTFGQFLKALASFSAPLLAAYVAKQFGGDWQWFLLIFLIIAFITLLSLSAVPISEEKEESLQTESIQKSFMDSFSLLKDNFILLAFIGILCNVGLDVGINISAPKFLMKALNTNEISEAAYATSIYFAFRTIGSFLGAFLLAKMATKQFYTLSIGLILGGLAMLLFSQNFQSVEMIYVALALLGLGNSNVFSIFFAQALLHKPQRQNEISGLMVMGISGGALFPMLMGYATQYIGLLGAIIVMAITTAYFLLFIPKIKKV